MYIPVLIISKSDLELNRSKIENEFWDYQPNKLVHDDKYEVLKSLNDILKYTPCKYKDEAFVMFQAEVSSESYDLQEKLEELGIYFIPYITYLTHIPSQRGKIKRMI